MRKTYTLSHSEDLIFTFASSFKKYLEIIVIASKFLHCVFLEKKINAPQMYF